MTVMASEPAFPDRFDAIFDRAAMTLAGVTKSFRRREWSLLVVAVNAIADYGQAKAAHINHPLLVLDRIINRVRAAATIDVRAVEQITGVTLRETDDGSEAFAFYEGKGVNSGAAALDVDLRMPSPGGGATGGALLVLNLSGQCPHRAEVEARYGPLTLVQVPRGKSADEEAHWSRRELWGELSFGFSSRGNDCLSSVVFTLPGKD